MNQNALFTIAALLAAGVACQWIAWRLKIPAILPLIVTGLLAGPLALGILHPQEQLGALYFPIVSISVAIILFEGSLTLNFREVRGVATVVRNLLLVGALVTWLGGAAAAHYVMGLSWAISLLFGALIVVTGPTVIAPLLRNVRPTAAIASVLKWEGILIDPLGALLAVLIFDFIVIESAGVEHTLFGLIRIIGIGVAFGISAGYAMYTLLVRYLIPDYLRDFAILSTVALIFALSNSFAPESGLLAVTVMGIFLANTDLKSLREIWYFKERLSIILISTLFILLAANITPAQVAMLDWRAFVVLAIVMFLLRPIGVHLSAWGSSLKSNERHFLSWIAPRGIVAAAVSSLFAFELHELGYPEADILAPLVFLVIVGTVLVQGATAKPLAKRLGVSEADPQGFLLMGGFNFAHELATTLTEAGILVRLIDTNYENVAKARLAGLDAYHGNVLSDAIEESLNLSGIGRLLAITRNDEANALACKHMEEEFSSSEVYQLQPRSSARNADQPSRFQLGRILFEEDANYDRLADLLVSGATVKRTAITEQFTYEDLRGQYDDSFILLMIIRNQIVSVATVDQRLEPVAGDMVISLTRARAAMAIAEIEVGPVPDSA